MNEHCFRVLCTAVALGLPMVTHAQSRPIPVRAVAPPRASVERFKIPPNVRHLPDGRVLVNDPLGQRLIVFDSTLSSYTISADSNGTNGAASYPMSGMRNPLTPYLGDSTLFIDFQARTFVLVDPQGRFGRAMSHPKALDLMSVSQPFAGTPGADGRGRLYYRAMATSYRAAKEGEPPNRSTRDTLWVVRADFEARTIDTIATYTVPRFANTVVTTGQSGKSVGTLKVPAMPAAPDEWAVLSDGTLAIVRQHDYHVDWVGPDGTKSSTAKLPYDWRRLTDDDKRARVDSMKRVTDSMAVAGTPYGRMFRFTRTPDGGAPKTDTIIPTLTFDPIEEMPDYVPPIRQGAVKADEDGNLWILPTTSSHAGGGLLYDVVNPRSELVERVRIPADRLVIGFGRGGVVYLARSDVVTKTWVLERTRVLR
jgi:hypothetical protein